MEVIGKTGGIRAERRAGRPVSTPLRVCLLSEFFWPDLTGGTGTVLSELVGTLRAYHSDAIEIEIVTSRRLYRRSAGQDDGLLPEQDEWNGVRIRRVDSPAADGKGALPRLAANTRFCLAALRVLRREHRRTRYDLVVIGTAPPMLAAAAGFFRLLTGTPYLYIIYDLDPDRAVVLHVLGAGSPGARVLQACQHRWLHGAGRVVVLGRCMREHLIAAYGLPQERVAVVPIGSNPDEIHPLPASSSAFRHAQGLERSFVVLYSGNFGRYHNFNAILDAAKQVARSAPSVEFVLVGGGAQRASVERRVADERIANVRLLPFVETADYPDLLAAADVSLVTLEPGMEGLCVPSKFYSILASGRPVLGLMGPNCEVARVLAEENCGVRVDAGDADALSRAVLTLAAQTEQCAEMGKRSRAALESRFTSRSVADLYLEAMRAAASRQDKQDRSTEEFCPPVRIDDNHAIKP